MATKRRARLLVAVMLLLVVLGSASATAQREQVPPWREPMPAALPTAEITVGDIPVTVEVAITPEEQALGLGYRNGLDSNRGMLFVFQEPAEVSFWMDGMRFCLDIVWIANGEITGAAEDICPEPPGTDKSDLRSYPSDGPVTHVLEMPAGWLAAHGLGTGTPVEIPEPLA